MVADSTKESRSIPTGLITTVAPSPSHTAVRTEREDSFFVPQELLASVMYPYTIEYIARKRRRGGSDRTEREDSFFVPKEFPACVMYPYTI